jgi:hypothetical protein
MPCLTQYGIALLCLDLSDDNLSCYVFPYDVLDFMNSRLLFPSILLQYRLLAICYCGMIAFPALP